MSCKKQSSWKIMKAYCESGCVDKTIDLKREAFNKLYRGLFHNMPKSTVKQFSVAFSPGRVTVKLVG